MNSHHEIRHNGSRKMLALIMTITMFVNMIGSGALYALAEETSQETVQTEKAVLQTEKQTEKPAPQPETAAPQPETPAPQPETAAPQPETPAPQPETAAPQPETAAQSETAAQTEGAAGSSGQPGSEGASEEESTEGSQTAEPATEITTEKAAEAEKNTRVEYRAEISGAKVTVILSDPEAVPDDAELVVEEVPAGADDEIAYHAYFFGVPSGKNKKEAEAGKLNLESGSAQITFQFTNRQLEDRIRLTEAADLVVSQDKDGASDVVPADVFVTEEKVSFTVSYVSTFHFVNQNYKAEEEAETDTEEAAAVETEAETEAETEDLTEAETEEEAVLESTRVRYAVSNDGVMVTAILEDAAAIPDDAELTVTKVTENEACIIYDISFIGSEKDADGNDTGNIIEYEPENGSVKVTMKFLENQLTQDLGIESSDEVAVVHIPDAGTPESVDAKVYMNKEVVVFDLASFSTLIIGRSTDENNPFLSEDTYESNGGTYEVGETIQYLLEHFQVISRGNANLSSHTMGSILVGGDLTGTGGFADDPDSAKTVSSYIGGSVADYGGKSGGRNGGKDLAPLYVGSVNEIVGTDKTWENYTVDGKINFNQTDSTNNGNNVYTSDSYVDWDKLYDVIRQESQMLKEQGATGRPAVSEDGSVLTITAGQYVTIESLQGVSRINIIGDITTAVNTIINVLDAGEVNMPTVTVNGNDPGTGESGAGTSYVWNFPNATKINLPNQNFLGHMVAPDASVHQNSGQYTGGFIVKDIDTGAEGHTYWYNGGKLIGDEEGFAANKIFTGGIWPAGTSYTIQMSAMTAGAPQPNHPTVTLTQDNSTADFGDIRFSPIEGKNETVHYRYRVVEVKPDDAPDDITYDSSYYDMDIEVKYTSEGHDHTAAIVKTMVSKDGGAWGTITAGKLYTFGFANDYHIETQAHMEVTKEIAGPWNWNSSQNQNCVFDFQLTPVSGAPMPEGKSVLNASATSANQTAVFEDITFTSKGVFSYVIKEVVPTGSDRVPGIEYDDNEYYATVEVNYIDGELVPTVTYNGGKSSLTITNNSAEGKAELSAKKAANAALGETLFQFELLDASGEVIDTSEGVKQGETATFKAIEYDLDDVGEYTYTIREVIPKEVDENNKLDGITYDTHEETVKVKVENAGGGKLTVTYNGKDSFTTPEFVNSYSAEGKAELSAKKAANAALGDTTFQFKLLDADGNEIETSEGVKQGETAAFKAIEYDLDDVGEHTYKIKEVIPDGVDKNNKLDGITYDTHEETVKVKVENAGGGKLTVTYNGKDSFTTPEFVNSYSAEGKAELSAKKAANAALGDTTFQFKLLDADGNEIETSEGVKQGETAAFKAIEYDLDDVEEHTYKIKEVIPDGVDKNNKLDGITYDTHEETVTVKVENAGGGKLTVTYNGKDSFTTPEFVNSYSAEGKAELSAKKAANTNLGETKFQFELLDADGNEIETSEGVKQGETATFTAIEYDLDDVGEYTYTIKEVIPDGVDKNNKLDGITYDTHEETVKVKVENAGGGKLTVTYNGKDSFTTPEFVNSYSAEGKAELSAKKAANTNLGETKFQFELLDADGNEIETSEGVKQGETATFTAIEYDLDDVGEYTYTIKEVIPDGVDKNNKLDGITYDTHEETVKVKVENAGGGKLTVTYNGKDSFTTPEFVNSYSAEGKAELSAKKAANTNLGETKFQFELLDADGNEIETSEGVKQGETATFTAIEYDLDDVGEYTYTIKEVVPDGVDKNNKLDGITYDTHEETVKVKVENAGGGKLTVTYNGKEKFETPEFTNTYSAEGEAELSAKKAANADLGDTLFQFELLDASGEVIDTSEGVKQGETATFKAIEYDLDDVGEHTYKIKEVIPDGVDKNNKLDGITYDTHEETVTVKVENGGGGELTITYNGKDSFTTPEFENTYSAEGATSFKVTKSLEGRDWKDADKFTFTVTGSDGAPMPEMTTGTATKAAKDVTFGPIELTNKDAGKTYTYKITEDIPKDAVKGVKDGITYDGHTVTVTITPEDDGKGNITAEPVYSGSTTFTNVYEEETYDLNINKTFTGAKVKAPDKLSFTVTGPDGYKKTISYSEFTDGKYVLKDLEPGTYKVVENNADIKGYTLKTTVSAKDGKIKVGERTRADIRFVNDYSNVPRTADDTPLLNWIITMVAALYISIIAAYFRRKLLRCV